MKKDIFILLAISLVTSVYVLANSDTDSLYRKVQGFGIGLPQEKVYLHLDNTCYFLGDTIWYKGYVTRSDKGTLTDLAKYYMWNCLLLTGTPWNDNNSK